MNVLDDFLDLLRTWRGHGLQIDDDEVRAPHAAIARFDLDGLGEIAGQLRSRSADAAGALTELRACTAELPASWGGTTGAELASASARLAVALEPAAQALAVHADSATVAHQVLTEVVDDYTATMAQAGEPIAGGTPEGQVREELLARLDLAAAAGRAAGSAVTDGLAVLREEWRSAGELILAGER